MAAQAEIAAPSSPTDTRHFDLSYTPVVTSIGTYYHISSESDFDVSAGRPVQPITGTDIHQPNTIAHGVLMLGGSFTA